jgi:hypothetical protein
MKIRLIGFFLMLMLVTSSCLSSKKNPTSGRYAGRKPSYMNAASMKSKPFDRKNSAKFHPFPNPITAKQQPLRKNYIIKNARTFYLGQQNPK